MEDGGRERAWVREWVREGGIIPDTPTTYKAQPYWNTQWNHTWVSAQGGEPALHRDREPEKECAWVFEEARRGFQLRWDVSEDKQQVQPFRINSPSLDGKEKLISKGPWCQSNVIPERNCTRELFKEQTSAGLVLKQRDPCITNSRVLQATFEIRVERFGGFSDVFRDGTTGSQPIPVFGDLNDVRGRWKWQRELRLGRPLFSLGHLGVRP